VSVTGAHFEKNLSLTCVRWSVAYPLSYRQLEEMMRERGVAVDHATMNRWVLKYAPQREEVAMFRRIMAIPLAGKPCLISPMAQNSPKCLGSTLRK
jgi:transposase-like protein